nr:uncharacterized mitochondrial protein AtMg00820-like [Nicotiana tomentosiformis]
MSQFKEFNEENTTEPSLGAEEPGSFITITEAEDRVADVVQETPDAESKIRNWVAFSIFLYQIEPKNIKEALKDFDWITVMQDELHQFERNRVWHLVPRPSDITVIGAGWVFRNKLNEFGNITRNKARLVVQGCNQEEGINYDETLARVARM